MNNIFSDNVHKLKLEKIEGKIRNGQTEDIGHTGHSERQTKQNKNTIQLNKAQEMSNRYFTKYLR